MGNRACALLALVLVATVLVVRPAGASTDGTFVALTYNVAGLTDPISGSEPATNSALISPLLNDYDLVLLQEDWEDPLRQYGLERPTDEIPAIYYHHEVVGEADHPHRSDPAHHPFGTDLRRAPSGPTYIADGLNRLSEFPFGTLTRQMWEMCNGEFHFAVVEAILEGTGLDDVFGDAGLGVVNEETDGGASDCAAQKGFSVARTELAAGVEVDVYNLHGEAGSHPADNAARADNFRQLTEFIQQHSTGRAVIVGGDTNLKPDHDDPGRAAVDGPAYDDFLAGTGLTDACTALDCGEDVIDKFFFRSGGGIELTALTHDFERDKFQRNDGEPLSDHDPLAVTFSWHTV